MTSGQESEWCANVDDLAPNYGDLIEFNRKTYCHWAMYVGNGEVFHINPANSEEKIGLLKLEEFVPGLITKDPLIRVAGTSEIRINNKTEFRVKPRSLDDIRKIVTVLLENPSEVNYCLKHFNCEHLVTFVKFGRRYSDQMNPIKGIFYSAAAKIIPQGPVGIQNPANYLSSVVNYFVHERPAIAKTEATLMRLLKTAGFKEVFVSS